MADNKRGRVYVPAQVLMRREGAALIRNRDTKKDDLVQYASRWSIDVPKGATAETIRQAISRELGVRGEGTAAVAPTTTREVSNG